MSFFNKLRGDIGIEPSSVKTTEGEGKKTAIKKKTTNKTDAEKRSEPKKELKSLKIDPEEIKPSSEEGQLAIDVFETEDDIVIQSTIGGIKAEDLDVSIEDDMVTIRGSRENKIEKEGKKYFYQECFWGSFMRKVILPEEVDAGKSTASIKDGVLTLTMPKIHRKTKKKITIQQEE